MCCYINTLIIYIKIGIANSLLASWTNPCLIYILTENLDGVIKILSTDLVIGDESDDDDDDDMDYNRSTVSELAEESFAMKGVEASPGASTSNEMSLNDSTALQSQDVSQVSTPDLSAKDKKKRKRRMSASSDIRETSEINESLNDSNAFQCGDISPDGTPVKQRKHKKKKRQLFANSDTVEGEETQINPEKHSSCEIDVSSGGNKKQKKKKNIEISPNRDQTDIEKVEEISKSIEEQSSTSPEARTPKKRKRLSEELTQTSETETSINEEKKKDMNTNGKESDFTEILDRSAESNAETRKEFKSPKGSKKKRSLNDSPQSQSENISQEETPRNEPKRKKRKLFNTPLSTLDDF